MNRRTAMITAAGAGIATATLRSTASAAPASSPALKPGSVILFQGDSITDCGRDKKPPQANHSAALGRGYAFLIAASLLMRHPDLGLKTFNRGISGNKIPDLDARWKRDCIALKPDVLSILIGVNDIWHKLNGRYDGTVEIYESGFTALLEKTKAALPDTRLVICEPFVMRCGAVNDSWFPEFTERKAVAKRVAQAAGATWVPFQDTFDAAIAKGTAPEYWAADGVHPSLAGHLLMADAWSRATGI